MATSATQPNVDHLVTLIIRNESLEPIRLKKGQVIGSAQPVYNTLPIVRRR